MKTKRPIRGKDITISITAYKAGAIAVHPAARPAKQTGETATRGKIADCSSRSRIRAAWTFANAETNWSHMVLLSYPWQATGSEAKPHLLAWRKRMLRRWPDQKWAWIMEFCESGWLHFHFFLGDGGLAFQLRTEKLATRRRKGKDVAVASGAASRWIWETWLEVIGASDDVGARKFSYNGITEPLRSPDAAARYVAKEAGKRAQKMLPSHLEGAGAWWGMDRRIKPKARGKYEILVRDWPYKDKYSKVFDLDHMERAKGAKAPPPLLVTRPSRPMQATVQLGDDNPYLRG